MRRMEQIRLHQNSLRAVCKAVHTTIRKRHIITSPTSYCIFAYKKFIIFILLAIKLSTLESEGKVSIDLPSDYSWWFGKRTFHVSFFSKKTSG